jgi:hypothetical protein
MLLGVSRTRNGFLTERFHCGTWWMKRNFLQALLAVVAGNAMYFVLLMPHLPPAARHGVGQLDLGLGIDFLLCAALYLLVRRLDRTRKGNPGRRKQC